MIALIVEWIVLIIEGLLLALVVALHIALAGLAVGYVVVRVWRRVRAQ